MLVSARPAWRYVMPQIGRPLGGLFLYSVVVSVLVHRSQLVTYISMPDLPLSMMGAALGIFLGFRTNSAYDRWWEARMLWGQLVNQSRSLARQAISFTRAYPDQTLAQRWVQDVLTTHIAFVHVLRSHLRREKVLEGIPPFLDEPLQQSLASAVNVPAALIQRLGSLLAEAAASGMLDGFQLQRLDETLSALTDVQGGCERIKNTPLPRQYDLFPEVFTYLYCALLPLGLVSRVGLATPAIVVLVAFIFLATNRIGRNIENPFESSPHDTPMTALSVAIERELRQQLGQEIPKPMQAQNGVLM